MKWERQRRNDSRMPAVEWCDAPPRTRVETLKPTLAQFFGLTNPDCDLIRKHREVFARDVEELTQNFYDHLLATPETAGYFANWSDRQLRELSRKQTAYFLRMLDAELSAARTREILSVAERHRRLGIPATWIGAAYAVYLAYGRDRVASASLTTEEKRWLGNAFERLVFVDRELQLVGYDSDRRMREFQAGLTEINQLIARRPTIQELYAGSCRIAVERCGLPLAWVGLVSRDGKCVEVTTAAGVEQGYVRDLHISLDPDSIFSRDPVARAVRSGSVVIVRDMTTADYVHVLRDRSAAHGLRSIAVLPIRRGTATNGVLAVCARESGVFTAEVAALLQTLAVDVSRAVTELRYEVELERLRSFYAVLSEVNQLIARNCPIPQLCVEACRIVAERTGIFLVYITRTERNSNCSRVVAAGGEGQAFAERLAEVIDTGEAGVSSDSRNKPRARAPLVHKDPRSPALSVRCRAAMELFGVGAWAAFPLVGDDESDFGTLVMCGRDEDYFFGDILRLLRETAGDIGFAIGERRRRNQLAQLQGFYAALGELGTLVAEISDADELMRRACALVAVHTGALLACVARVDPDAEAVHIETAVGQAARYADALNVSLDPDQPEGWGVVGRVYQSQKPVIIPDTTTDPGIAAQRRPPARFGLYAMAGFPLARGKGFEMVLVLAAGEPDYFGDPLVELLERLANALGAGLAHISAASRARRLEMLYAALSSVNELIARNPAPRKLFTETCRDLSRQLEGIGALVLEAGGDGQGGHITAFAGEGADDGELWEILRWLMRGDTAGATRGTRVFHGGAAAPTLQRWRERLRRLGVQGLGIFPMARRSGATSALAIVSKVPDFFDTELITLFERLAENMSFSLERYAQGRALQRMAFTDPLTELPNRALFIDRLGQALVEASQGGHIVAVSMIDLDGFKQINDRLGHPAGDLVLKEIARRLKIACRGADTVARLGGDEFGLILRSPQGEAGVQSSLERLLAVIGRPLNVKRERFSLSASIGVALYSQDADGAEELLRLADLAMYRAKHQGGHGWSFYTEAMERRLAFAHGLQREFARALRRDHIVLCYQPQVDLATGRVFAAEGLVRWLHPDKGALPTSEWIDVVEEDGQMIRALGRRVLALAIRQLTEWHAKGIEMSVSVNMGARHILSPHFLFDLDAALAGTPELAPWLGIEITESALIQDFDACSAVLQQCRRRGLRLSIDDFGVGHASLRYMHVLPVDSVKIDQSFVHDLLDDVRALGIVAGTLQASRLSRIDAVAEGVETVEQGVVLHRLGCRLMQGIAIAQPMDAVGFEAWRKRWRNPDAWRRQAGHTLGAEYFPLVASMTFHRGVARAFRGSPDGAAVQSILRGLDCPLEAWKHDKALPAAAPRELVGIHERLHELEKNFAREWLDGRPDEKTSAAAASALEAFMTRAEALLQSQNRRGVPSAHASRPQVPGKPRP